MITTNEQTVKDEITIDASLFFSGDLMRNNSGAFKPERGGIVRYGLGNTSAKINKKFKSSDLIGIIPVTVTANMVGKTLGVFCAIEAKRPGWGYTDNEHEAAQLAFLDHIRKLGGIASFCTCVAEFRQALTEWITCKNQT